MATARSSLQATAHSDIAARPSRLWEDPGSTFRWLLALAFVLSDWRCLALGSVRDTRSRGPGPFITPRDTSVKRAN